MSDNAVHDPGTPLVEEPEDTGKALENDHGLTQKLHATTDAQVWAQEFMAIFGGEDTEGRAGVGPQIDEGTMAGWFANAMYAQESKDSRDKHTVDIARATSGKEFTFSITEGERLTLRTAVQQAVGAASTCWDEEKVFDSERALHIADQLLHFISYHTTGVNRYTVPVNPDGSEPELPTVGTVLQGSNTVVVEVFPEHREVVTVNLPLEPAS